MRDIIVILILLMFVCVVHSLCGDINTHQDIQFIKDQSFIVEFEDWGKVKFNSCIKDDRLIFVLTNATGAVLYTFPEFHDNDWFFYQLSAISFRDVNNDHKKDVIVIAYYLAGVGKGGAVPFPVCNIYFQRDMQFTNIAEIDDTINESGKNNTVKDIVDFLKDKSGYMNDLLTTS